jgi:beta-N-acetylhexosaminidase
VRSPYDLLKFPDASVSLATYNWNDPALEALVSILDGSAQPQGRLPVELPGAYPLGAGINR